LPTEQDLKLLSKDNSNLEQQNKQRASVDDEGGVSTEGDSGLQPEDQEIMLPDSKSSVLHEGDRVMSLEDKEHTTCK
jgi:hypothetical protein